MKIHLIAIGGALMHSLAIALQKQGHEVSGSDDEIYQPSKSNLERAGLLPPEGWNPARIQPDLDLVIVGMHAKADNPELLRAQDLGVKICSYPEYLYLCSQQKTRIVVAGSHGKTSTTAAIMHLLRCNGVDFDYAVGAKLAGFDNMVKLSDAPIIVIEGDEYLSSPIDRQPKFWHYRPQLAVLTGISWDHINVFPTFEHYLGAFRQFIHSLPANGRLFYYQHDPHIQQLLQTPPAAQIEPYEQLPHQLREGNTELISPIGLIPIKVFGQHNLENLSAVVKIGLSLGLSPAQIFPALGSFEGASKRLERVYTSADGSLRIFKDFAHAPSKVKATVSAVKRQFPQHRLIACLELHTFSSLNPEFLPQYSGSLSEADQATVFINPQTLSKKGSQIPSQAQIQANFQQPNLTLQPDADKLWAELSQQMQNKQEATVLLMMSSGHWAGKTVESLADFFPI